MIELYWTLFWEFFKTGLFALGGGLSTIPFLYEMMEKYHWFTQSDLMNMIAVSESTPGPIGVNMATYVGYHVTGNSILGGVVATLGLVAPSVIIICIIAKALSIVKDSVWVKRAFEGLRPAVTAMIASAGLGVFITVVWQGAAPGLTGISWPHLILFIVLSALVLAFPKKIHPIALICLCAVIGIVFSL